jgi:hypothetical protein
MHLPDTGFHGVSRWISATFVKRDEFAQNATGIVPPTSRDPMAQKVQVVLVDDLDNGPADETVTFSLDGVSYEIDLSHDNAAKLRDVLATYVGHARPVAVGRIGAGQPRRRARVGQGPGHRGQRARAHQRRPAGQVRRRARLTRT